MTPQQRTQLTEWLDRTTRQIYEELTAETAGAPVAGSPAAAGTPAPGAGIQHPANQPGQTGAKQPDPAAALDDELGEFYLVLHPEEGKDPKSLVSPVTALALSQKVAQGELSPEKIAALVRKEGQAHSRAGKLVSEFTKNLMHQRKLEIQEWKNKRQWVESRYKADKAYYGKGQLDETTKGNFSKMEETLKLIDAKIGKLTEKLKSTGKSGK